MTRRYRPFTHARPVPVRVTFSMVWEIVVLTVVCALSVFVLPFAVVVLMGATL